jgi:GH24 family phage-related lysozyme (muramidase)
MTETSVAGVPVCIAEKPEKCQSSHRWPRLHSGERKMTHIGIVRDVVLPFRFRLILSLERYEERRDYLYKDKNNKVTIGVGCLVRDESHTAQIKLLHRDDDEEASLDEKKAAFRAVKAAPFQHQSAKDHKIHTWSAGHYKTIKGSSNLYMPDTEIDRIRDAHINEFHRYLRHHFSVAQGLKREFDSLPDNVRLALFDMMFNLGPTRFPSRWPKFNDAVKHENWKEAARQSRRPEVQPERNQFVHDLLVHVPK